MYKDEIIDGHMHLWDLDHGNYPWLNEKKGHFDEVIGKIDQLYKNFLITDYEALVKPYHVAKCVHLEANSSLKKSLYETEWLQKIADHHGFPNGIVFQADLRDPDIENVLKDHCQFPKWPPFDMGLAKPDRESDLGSYYDFLRFADQSYCIALGEYKGPSIEGLSYTGLLKGMVQSLTRNYLTSADLHFEPITFITALNEMIAAQGRGIQFFFQLLTLSPSTNQFSFISCGCGSLLHLQLGSLEPRFLPNQNPPLGKDPNHGFYETTESWTEGDHLIVHSFDVTVDPEKHGQDFEDALRHIMNKNLQLSAQSQAEALINDIAQTFPQIVQASPKTVLAIQRIT